MGSGTETDSRVGLGRLQKLVEAGIELDLSRSFFLALTLIMIGLGLRLWWIRECATPNSPSDLKIPTRPCLLMGFGLATSTGSLIIVRSSVLAGIVWWLGTPFEALIQAKNNNNFIAGLNHIWAETVLGIGMFLLALLTFFIHSI